MTNIHMNGNIKEKALELELTKSEVGTLIKGLEFQRKPYLQNANVCLNNVLNPAGSKKKIKTY